MKFLLTTASVFFLLFAMASETMANNMNRGGSGVRVKPSSGMRIQPSSRVRFHPPPRGPVVNVYDQIRADRERARMERWRIQRETQTKIFEQQQEITINRARNQDRGYRAWDNYIRQ
jgi:hypothetical protein